MEIKEFEERGRFIAAAWSGEPDPETISRTRARVIHAIAKMDEPEAKYVFFGLAEALGVLRDVPQAR
ncbi:MAG: hypothetical protein DI596_15990 [Azospira oryzae]|uniref:Uncharacterized protein n=1 Tax=Pelomicrobium methylotrophicum TaxID=2602750 RepID=A0A5C7EJM4_9PROT|nr:hypothetical protein [Pelomicrobium methylotrophicum]PZP48924.1 MAG: hypothetical protein DI596_15990 [Azospira oryzae]PZP73645.1 MAG: hypothetical protein DI593_15990 [Azospira oryzae]TXF11633.1 hypothetical protein FR698_09855 [Pelomicrobium methylotrophicum]